MSARTYRPDDPNMGARVLWLEQVSEAAKVLSRSRVPNQFSGNKGASKISFEPEPSVVREPAFDLDAPHARSHLRSRTKVVLIGGLVSILSLVDLTAITTIGQSTFADAWQGLALDRTFELISRSPSPTPETFAKRAEPSSPRLVVEGARGAPGEPAPLGLRIRGDAKGAMVHIKGLMPGMELSTWYDVDSDAWQISAADLDYAWVAPPKGFVGSADLIAELRLSNDKIADRRAIHLEWMAPISPEPARPEPDRESIPQLQPERQDVQPQRIIDPPHLAFLPLPQDVPQSTGAKGITVESRAEPEITNSTCYASASAVRQDHPEAWPSWTLRALGHEGTKCWYPTTRTLAHAHPK